MPVLLLYLTKLKGTLCSVKHPNIKMCKGNGCINPPILNFVVDVSGQFQSSNGLILAKGHLVPALLNRMLSILHIIYKTSVSISLKTHYMYTSAIKTNEYLLLRKQSLFAV